MRSADTEFKELKNDLVNGEVVHFATNLHSVLSVLSNKYSNDAIIDLIPELTCVLNKLDACFKVNEELKKNPYWTLLKQMYFYLNALILRGKIK